MPSQRVKDEVVVIDDAEAPEARPGQAEPRAKCAGEVEPRARCEACAASAALNRRNQRLEAELQRVRLQRDLQAALRTKLHEMLALIERYYLAAVSPPHEEPPAKRARAE
jgi:hypothetical protein